MEWWRQHGAFAGPHGPAANRRLLCGVQNADVMERAIRRAETIVTWLRSAAAYDSPAEHAVSSISTRLKVLKTVHHKTVNAKFCFSLAAD